MRTLSTPNDAAAAEGYLITDPGVLEATIDGKLIRDTVSYVRVLDDNDRVFVAVSMYDGSERWREIESRESVEIAPESRAITFSSGGTMYHIRAIEDEDGVWMSPMRASVPAEALEAIVDMEVNMAFSPMAPAADELLFVTIDPDSGAASNLVYSGVGGMFLRDSGGWFKLPADDDTTLDDLEVVDVKPSIIDAWDEAQKAGEPLTTEVVRQHENMEAQ